MGEQLDAAEMTDRGLLGDRAYALVDRETGKVASAKFPRKWPTLFAHRATYVKRPSESDGLPAVRITLPDGRIVSGDDADLDRLPLCRPGPEVALDRSCPRGAEPRGILARYGRPRIPGRVDRGGDAARNRFPASFTSSLTRRPLAPPGHLSPGGRFALPTLHPPPLPRPADRPTANQGAGGAPGRAVGVRVPTRRPGRCAGSGPGPGRPTTASRNPPPPPTPQREGGGHGPRDRRGRGGDGGHQGWRCSPSRGPFQSPPATPCAAGRDPLLGCRA